MRTAAKVELLISEAQIPVRLAERAKLIWLAAQGKTDKEIDPEKRLRLVLMRRTLCVVVP
jgi:hypothetical protein